MEMMEQFNYEKISDDLFYFGNSIVLRFNLDLGRKDKDGFKIPFHNEYNYKSNKYPNVKSLTTLRRTFDFYLTLENTKYIDGVKEYIQLRIQDMIYLRDTLNLVYSWFTDKKYNGLFKPINGKLEMIQGFDLGINILDGLVMDKYIKFEPVITVYNQREEQGVRIYLNSDSNFVDISFERFLGFKYLIDSINLYESAQIMLNYIPQIPYGTNAIVFEDDYNVPQEQDGAVTGKVEKREVPSQVNKSQKSFFAKMEEL